MALRVAFVNTVSVASGAEHTLRDLLAYLPPEIDPVVICPGPVDAPLPAMVRELGVAWREGPEWRPRRRPVTALVGSLIGLVGVGRKLGAALAEVRPDVVHINSVPAGVAFLSAQQPVPWVWHARDLRMMRRVGGDLAEQAPATVAISRCVAAVIRQCAPRAAMRLQVIYNGVDVERLRRDAAAGRGRLREELGLPEGAPLAGTVAQLVPWKQVEVLIKVAAALRDLAATWVVAGADLLGEHRDYVAGLHRLADELGVADRVHWLGYRTDAAAVIGDLDVYVHTASEEPLGRTILESMALGVPVVAPAAAGPAEILSYGDSGLLYEPGDAEDAAALVRRILADSDLRTRLIAGATSAVETRFTAARMAEEFAEVYRTLAG